MAKAKTVAQRERKFAEDFPVGSMIKWRKPLWLSGNAEWVPPGTGTVTGTISGAPMIRMLADNKLITATPKQECEAV